MSAFTLAIAALSLGSVARAQQAGTLTPETHPRLSVSTCTTGGTCTSKQQSVVLDGNWRWVHSTSGSTNCYTGNKWDATLCPNGVTCAANCAMDGADYSGTYGIQTSGSELSLKLVTGANVGSRVYLMNEADTAYQMFNLKNQEFTFDTDVSQLGCGLNGALYFVSMDSTGGLSSTNRAGAKYGTGYCDAQCARDIKFIEGKANVEGWGGTTADSGVGNTGSCCNEMDIWEANSISNAVTPHSCQPGRAACKTLVECGAGDGNRYKGFCDRDGCDFNPFRMDNETFYGPGKTIDTTKKVTVVTQFITSDGTAAGDLTEIRRLYVQDGKVFRQPDSNVAGVPGNVVSDAFCDAQKSVFGDNNYFKTTGGMKAMGDAFANGGMVLVMSLWDDFEVNMHWLNSAYPFDKDPNAPGVARGTCPRDSGKPEDIRKNTPNATVRFSNIKSGPIGSTYSGTLQPGGSGGSSSSSSSRSSSSTSTTSRSTTTTSRITTTTTTTTSNPATTTTPSAGVAQKWGQCGGQGWTGPTTCVAGTTCVKAHDFYSQCL